MHLWTENSAGYLQRVQIKPFIGEMLIYKKHPIHLQQWSLYPLFSLEKKGILISCQSRSVVGPSVRPLLGERCMGLFF